MSGLASLLPKPKNDLPTQNKTREDHGEFDISVDRLEENQNGTGLVATALEGEHINMKKYEVIARVGHSDERLIQTELRDMQPAYFAEEELARPSLDQVQQETEETRKALQAIIMEKTAKTQPKNIAAVNASSRSGTQIIKYTPKGSQNAQGHNSGASSRIIKMVQMPTDPLEPPKFHHKRVPRAPPSPPAPRLHSPPRKVTAEEQKTWHIPPCISSWKNPKGYTVPLDKRLASDGKTLQEKSLNSRISDLAEALFLAEKHNREEVEMRAAVERKVAEQEKRKKDEHLRQMAEQAREEARRIAEDLKRAEREEERYLRAKYDGKVETGLGITIREREQLRRERDYEREREFRMSRMNTEQRAKLLEREADRDISEKITLGIAQPAASKESLFDERLFDRNSGLGTGFGAGDDDMYNLYDKPLFTGSAVHMIYRPQVGGSHANDGEDEDYAGGKRKVLQPNQGFSGAETVTLKEGPVQFERREGGNDPFGLDQFLSEAKKGKKGLDTRQLPSNK